MPRRLPTPDLPAPALLLSLLLVATLLAAPPSVAADRGDPAKWELPDVTRLAGPTRHATAGQVARHTHPSGADHVVVVTDHVDPATGHIDPILAGSYAAAVNAPMLLVGPDQVPAATTAALDQLDPAVVTIIGTSTHGPSPAVVDRFRHPHRRVVDRRSATAASPYRRAGDLAAATRQAGAHGPAVLAATASWPDLLLAATLASGLNGVVLPVGAATPDRDTAPEWWDALGADVIVVGGTAAVPAAVTDTLTRTRDVQRLSGPDRETTAAAVAEHLAAHTTPDRVWVARSDDPADALAVVPAVGRSGVLLLVPPHDTPAAVHSPAALHLLPQVLAGLAHPCPDQPDTWCGHDVGVAAAGWIRTFAARTTRALHGTVIGGHAAVTPHADTQLAFLLATGPATTERARPPGCVRLPASPSAPGAWQAVIDSATAPGCFTIPAGIHRRQQITPRTGDMFWGEPGAVMDGSTPLTGPWDTVEVAGRTVWRHRTPVDQTYVEPAHCNAAAEQRFPGRTCHTQDVFSGTDDDVRFLTHAGRWDDTTIEQVVAHLDTHPGDYMIQRSHPTSPAPDAATVWMLTDPSRHQALHVSSTAMAFNGEQYGPDGPVDVDDVTIVGLEVRHYAPHFQRGAINGKFADGWVVTDVQAHHNHAAGVALGRSGLAARIVAADNGQIGFVASGTAGGDPPAARILLHDSTLSGNNQLGVEPNWEAGAMKVTGAVVGVDIRNVAVHDNVGHGIWLDIDNGNAVVVDSRVDGPGHGIFYEISHGPALIAHNDVVSADIAVFVSTSNGALVVDNTLPGCTGTTGRAFLVQDGIRRGTADTDFVVVANDTPVTYWGGAVDIRGHDQVGIGPSRWATRSGFSSEGGHSGTLDPAAVDVFFEANHWVADPDAAWVYGDEAAPDLVTFDQWQQLGMDHDGTTTPCQPVSQP